MRTIYAATFGALVLLAACGPSPQEQHAMDQQRCSGFGFAPGSDAFAHCMMTVNQQREAQDAADRRAAADRAAADKRASDAAQAARDKADQDAWDKRTGQGAYASPSARPVSSPSPFPDPVDPIRKSIDDDMRKMEGAD
jgi:hypothetical protein